MLPSWQDFRNAARALARAPGYAGAAIVILAIGIGAVLAVFTLAARIVLAPLPFPHAERLVAVGHAAPGLVLDEAGLSDGTYLHYRAGGRALEDLAMYHESVVNLGGGELPEAERVAVATVTHTFFSVLGARTARGRLPTAADADRTGEPVVLISHDLWQRRYGGDPDIIGKTIEPNRVPRPVIGVLAPGFAFPRPEIGIWFLSDPDPAEARAADLYNQGIGRLAPGFDPRAAERELDRLLATLPEAYPDLTARVLADSKLRVVVTPLAESIVGDAGAALWLLLGGMACLLLIACANVANLALVRSEHRQREMAVRAALGAGRRHLWRAFFAEGLVLATVAGAAGLLLADAAVSGLAGWGAASLPRLHEVALDGRIFAAGVGLSLIVALLLAALPFWRYRRAAVGAALKEGSFGATAGRRRQRVRRLLVAAQVALALALLVGSALLAKSFWRLTRASPGFDAAGVLTAEIALPRSAYPDYEASRRFWEALLARVRALPGVEGAGAVTGLPLVPQHAFHDLAIEVEERPTEVRAAVSVYHVAPGYFEAMGIPLLAGEGLRPGAPAVSRPVLLSAAAARRLFPGGSAIGKRIRREVGDAPWATVQGVVGDVPRERIGGAPAEIVYLPSLAEPVDPGLRPSYGALVVRAAVPPATLAAAVRGALRELDPHLPLAKVRTMERIVTDSAARTVFVMVLLGVAALAALALGAVGLYGVISYAVSRRAHELGIRIALGAPTVQVRREVLRETVALVFLGIAAGTLPTLTLARSLRALLFEVSPADPLALVAMAALLLLVALLAAWLPARRAAAVDPVRALRQQ